MRTFECTFKYFAGGSRRFAKLPAKLRLRTWNKTALVEACTDACRSCKLPRKWRRIVLSRMRMETPTGSSFRGDDCSVHRSYSGFFTPLWKLPLVAISRDWIFDERSFHKDGPSFHGSVSNSGRSPSKLSTLVRKPYHFHRRFQLLLPNQHSLPWECCKPPWMQWRFIV